MKATTKNLVDGYGLRETNRRFLKDAGACISQCRKDKSMTQEELGARLGLGKAQISRIEKRESLNASTISRVFDALGMETRLDLEPIVEETEIASVVQDLVLCVRGFGERYGLTPSQAFNYLYRFGGIEFYLSFHDIEREESLRQTIEDLAGICSSKGGKL